MDTRRDAGVSTCPTPERTKTYFFCCMGGLFATFFPWWAFMLRFSSYEGFFAQCGGLFCYFFLHVGELFCLHEGFHVFMGFLWACPFPLGFFCMRMPLCNLHPMSSAITYSGHYVPNKAHCNTRVQFTITMK